MTNYYLAIDIGASSGRHILAHLEAGKIVTEEIHRFENKLITKNNQLCWDIDALFENILTGLSKCKASGKIPVSMAIDTWAVDFVLLDENDAIIGDSVSYRDSRTNGIAEQVYSIIQQSELYAKTGIAMQPFNTIYQLFSLMQSHPQHINKAKTFLMLPDYFNFLLTGKKMSEYTNATTTQLVNAKTNDWDNDILTRLNIENREMFKPIFPPKTSVGSFSQSIKSRLQFDCEVIMCCSHDTASAVMATPAQGNDHIFISSGTWSLIGVEQSYPNCTMQSLHENFTNSGGYDYRFAFLKNIMGLWLIQSVKRENDNKYSFDELCEAALKADFESVVDVYDNCFLAPKSMTEEIKSFCQRTGQKIPQTIGEIASCMYKSLAIGYAKAVEHLQNLTGKTIDSIHIIGGGSKDSYLNELTRLYTGKRVVTGPTEATALGNIMVQMIKAGEVSDLVEARSLIL